jgi:hypothetical protein
MVRWRTRRLYRQFVASFFRARGASSSSDGKVKSHSPRTVSKRLLQHVSDKLSLSQSADEQSISGGLCTIQHSFGTIIQLRWCRHRHWGQNQCFSCTPTPWIGEAVPAPVSFPLLARSARSRFIQKTSEKQGPWGRRAPLPPWRSPLGKISGKTLAETHLWAISEFSALPLLWATAQRNHKLTNIRCISHRRATMPCLRFADVVKHGMRPRFYLGPVETCRSLEFNILGRIG